MRVENGETHVDTDDARGGETPRITRYVLGVSLTAIIILFAIILLIWR
jgi:hypothetical protein